MQTKLSTMPDPLQAAVAPNAAAIVPDGAVCLQHQGLLQSMKAACADAALRRLALLLSPPRWQSLAIRLEQRRLTAGERLMARGDSGDRAYLVESGGLQVFVDGNGNRHSHRIALLQPGAVVGEPALFECTVRMATVEATLPSVVWGLSAGALNDLKAEDPALAASLLQAVGAVMAHRMRANLERGLPVA